MFKNKCFKYSYFDGGNEDPRSFLWKNISPLPPSTSMDFYLYDIPSNQSNKS